MLTTRSLTLPLPKLNVGRWKYSHSTGRDGTAIKQSKDPRPLISNESGTGLTCQQIYGHPGKRQYLMTRTHECEIARLHFNSRSMVPISDEKKLFRIVVVLCSLCHVFWYSVNYKSTIKAITSLKRRMWMIPEVMLVCLAKCHLRCFTRKCRFVYSKVRSDKWTPLLPEWHPE